MKTKWITNISVPARNLQQKTYFTSYQWIGLRKVEILLKPIQIWSLTEPQKSSEFGFGERMTQNLDHKKKVEAHLQYEKVTYTTNKD